MSNKTYLSLFSGIESATVALEKLNYQAVGFAELAPFASAVLKHHYPEVTNFEDITCPHFEDKIRHLRPKILIGGSPCQAFSLAGLRQSLDDARGNLTLSFLKIADIVEAPIVIWENVTGVLNTKDNAFGNFLTGLAFDTDFSEVLTPKGKTWAKAGFIKGSKRIVAWRTLNSKCFDTAQSRDRVFVVAVSVEHLVTDPQCHPLALFDITDKPIKSIKDINTNEDGIFCTSQDITPRAVFTECAYTLRAGNHGVNTVFNPKEEKLYTLSAEEMELLMGFPEGYTDIPFNNKKATFSQRAKVLGNSFVSTIIHWIVSQLEKDKDLILLDSIQASITKDNHVFEYKNTEKFTINDKTWILNGSEGNAQWNEVKLTDVVKFTGAPLSMNNTMGIVDRIDRKINSNRIKPKATQVLNILHQNIYKHIFDKLKTTHSLFNIEIGFLIRWAKEHQLNDIELQLQQIYTPMVGEDGSGNLGKSGFKLAYSVNTLNDELVTKIQEKTSI